MRQGGSSRAGLRRVRFRPWLRIPRCRGEPIDGRVLSPLLRLSKFSVLRAETFSYRVQLGARARARIKRGSVFTDTLTVLPVCSTRR